ncbi:hypothetical protein N7492_006689 [Penicillium capsulatum]|uniref:Protein efr3 n=1 Tax=Penicillium capsulatum TaxID=69766 RepID=A0A9W9LK20_9EURO|nr:hypothetical protein N7492_006689 [Penicillium capsulatum]KAJ6116525.1 hypothetical protein N7512_006250 [Penicillium capsulatum]
MESVRQSCRPKHQVLTLKCYPRYQKGVPEVKPNPSELSYLLYYASTRRSKLPKVGAFLEKRVAKDVWRRRLGNVQVALHILTALIEKVPRELPIYARSVLTILDTILQSNEISLVEDSLTTFETFCLHQDIATIAAEQGIAQKYRDVIRSYASFAHPSHSPAKTSPPVAIRWRNAGLRAIKSVVSSESLAADGGTTLKIILPVILENLYSADEDVLAILKERLREPERPERDGNANRRLSIATVHTVDTTGDQGDPALAAQSTADVDRQAELDARLLALRCLEKIIISGSNRGQIRFAATTILEFISTKRNIPQTPTQNESKATQDGNWATSLIGLVANWCPVQVRFVILVTAMDILTETNFKEDALDAAFTILSVVDWLLKSSVNMIGLSVMDILLALVQCVIKVLSPDTETEKKPDSSADHVVAISAQRKAFLALLEQAIGNLATHIYYGDQIADMVRAILRRFKPSANQESVAAPSTLATVHEGGVAPADSNQSAEVNGEKAHGGVFTHSAAKLTCLRAVKAILTVANLRAPATTAGSEARNPVGIHVWEGTQSLLRDSDQEVRFAYADAFLSWLDLETNKDDLKARVDTPKYIKTASKRESDPNRRSTSAPGNQTQIVALAAQSTFLRLLHLSIYDAAIDAAAVTSDVLLLHLVLASLVENLGVNAVQFGLPMVLKLQDDLFTSVDFGTATGRVNIGSLVHGYLLAITEKFNIESTNAGVEICNEVEKRRKNGQWLSQLRLPPTGIDGIAVPSEKITDDTASVNLSYFRNADALVGGIDDSYRQSVSSPPQSPPTSPARGFNFPVLSHTSAIPSSQIDSGLPSSVKEQLLSSWSREACLAAVEKESAKTLSLSGSRGGTLTRNSPANGAANGSPAGSASNKNRRKSVPEISRTSEPDSSKGSPVRVTELRRVLSVNNENPRKRSPLRGQVDASAMSDVSDDSESMVSGTFSVSEVDGDTASVQPPDAPENLDEDGVETPRASASAIALGADNKPPLSRTNSDDIPPVPPIPPTLSIPGGFPNDSQRSLLLERPSTAPDSRQSSFKGTSELNASKTRNKSLSRDKSRSNNSLATGINNAFNAMDSNGDTPLDGAQRDELKKLLDGFLAPEGSILANGDQPTAQAALNRSYSRRHVSGGGIGRPPY